MQVKESIQEEKKAQGWRCTGQEGETSLTHFSGSERGSTRWWEAGGWLVQSSPNQSVEFGNREPLEGL